MTDMKEAIDLLGAEEAAALYYDWLLWARSSQRPPKGQWRIHLYSRDHWECWHHGNGQMRAWQKVDEGRHDLGDVPLVSVIANPTGFMTARPPLVDMAWLNLAHWQSTSDQRHILHIARVPLLFGRGLQMAERGLEIGPNRLILSDDPSADLKFVEHSGAAIAARRQDLVDLEDKMAVMGFDMIARRPVMATATGRAIDAAHCHASLDVLCAVLARCRQARLCLII